MIVIILLLILLFVVILNINSSTKSNYTQFSTPFVTVGHRPYLGDYLPTVGEVPTGEGGFVDEDAAYSVPSTDALCEECVSHCVNWAVRHGLGTNLTRDRLKCQHYCQSECTPDTL